MMIMIMVMAMVMIKCSSLDKRRKRKIKWLKTKVYLIEAFCFATQDTKWV
jgi:hypothetical protein